MTSLLREVLVASCLAALVAVTGLWQGRARAAVLEARSIQQLKAIGVHWMGTAHRNHDDLALQQGVAAFAAAPGIRFAAVVGSDGRAIAHSQASLLGQRVEPSPKAIAVPLKDATGVWGTFVFAYANPALGKFLAAQSFIWTLGAASFVLLSFAFALRRRQAAVREAEDLRRLQAALSQEQRRSQREAAQAKRERAFASGWVQALLRREPSSMLCLDDRQRITGFSPSAPATFGFRADDAIGQAGQDVPALAGCASLWDEAWRRPGIWIGDPSTLSLQVLAMEASGENGGWLVRQSAATGSPKASGIMGHDQPNLAPCPAVAPHDHAGPGGTPHRSESTKNLRPQ